MTKIQHIRENGQLIGTLVAVKNEAKNVVNVGFSVVRAGDNPSKKVGVEIAVRRAIAKRNTKVPKKIEGAFRDFVTHLEGRREYDGFHVPMPDDFIYTFDPLHQHRH